MNIQSSNAVNEKHSFKTYADSGKVLTPYFGEKFNASKFKKEEQFSVEIVSSYSVWDKDNGYVSDVDYEIKVEFDTDPMYECIYFNTHKGNWST